MADVTWTKVNSKFNSDVFEVALTATDDDSTILALDPRKSVSIAVSTTGAASVAIRAYFEDVGNETPTSFIFDSGVLTSGGVDYIKSLLSGVSGLKIVGTITGDDTATAQVLVTSRE